MHLGSHSRALLTVVLLSAAASAQAADWSVEANVRLRQESVEDDAFAHGADATSLRLRGGLHGRFGDGWEALVEGEAIAAAGTYNDASNGRTAWPVIADAPGIELNQAWLRHTGERRSVTAGRQRQVLGNQRWIGNSGW